MTQQTDLFENTPFTFATGFLSDHAGQIITEPRIAVVELIANSYDAGARRVDVKWPDHLGDLIHIEDDGTGMTADEFKRRWRTFNYNRSDEQGFYVEYPPEVKGRKKRAFGQHGKGRYGAFCFADAYCVETWKEGTATVADVELDTTGPGPFKWTLHEEQKSGHGTRISAIVARNLIDVDAVREWIGTRFLVDPEFEIKINDRSLQLTQLENMQSTPVDVPPYGTVMVRRITSADRDRNTKFHGITWWVNNRMVGEPSWDGLDAEGSLLDGRRTEARRFSFVIEANILENDVKDDWRGFHASLRVNEVREAIRKHMIRALAELLAEGRRERKLAALAETKDVLMQLPRVSRKMVGAFVDKVQQECPSLSQGDLARTVTIFSNLEKARSGYELLSRLAACSPDDLDTWNHIMQEWTASSAEVVLSELKRRLGLIEQLQNLVYKTGVNELHDLHPLFEKGLWIFGPEYEAVDFVSNRAMSTVIRQLFGGADSDLSRRRPDIVTLPDSTVGAYTSDRYDDSGEVNGIRKALILELKTGGLALTVKEMHQGEAYAAEIRKAGLVSASTEIVVYVLGAYSDETEERLVGKNTMIRPMVYGTLLKRAHARTFNLQRKLEACQPIQVSDPEVEELLAEQQQTEFSSLHASPA